ncbi:MAG: hypothetical protein EXR57_05595 [Dehalococcoidia bacterium]|nr:hypothetical protein [Dehalococcoidia bacterium]
MNGPPLLWNERHMNVLRPLLPSLAAAIWVLSAACTGQNDMATASPAPQFGAITTPVKATTTTQPPSSAVLVPTISPTSGPFTLSTSTPLPERVVATGTVNRVVVAGTDGHIYTVRPDGNDRTSVSPPTGPGFPGGQFTWPVWSPDGGTVLFSSVLEARDRVGADVTLLRASAMGGGVATIYEDDVLSQGIGNGVPHFAMWSPDGERIALIAGTGEGLVTIVLDSETGTKLDGVALGSPVYMAWSSDSNNLLVHLQDLLFVHERGAVGGRGRRGLQLRNRALNYYTPQFAPRDNRFLYGDEVDGHLRLMMREADWKTSRDLGDAPGLLGFRWSPTADMIAIVRGGQEGLFESLSLYSLADGSERLLVKRTMYGFWWSPDGSKVAVAAVSSSYRRSVDWYVVDIASGSETSLGSNLPTLEFEFVLSFFDQFSNASQIWSPDSRNIVVSGAMLKALDKVPETRDQAQAPPVNEPEQAWVLDASGAFAPVAIGPGFLAFWSPK